MQTIFNLQGFFVLLFHIHSYYHERDIIASKIQILYKF